MGNEVGSDVSYPPPRWDPGCDAKVVPRGPGQWPQPTAAKTLPQTWEVDELPDDSRVVEDGALEGCDLGQFSAAWLGCRRFCGGRPRGPGQECPHLAGRCAEELAPFDLANHALSPCPCALHLAPAPRPGNGGSGAAGGGKAGGGKAEGGKAEGGKAGGGKAGSTGRPRPTQLGAAATQEPVAAAGHGAAGHRAAVPAAAAAAVAAAMCARARTLPAGAGLSSAARLTAALAVAQKRWPKSKAVALLYRLTEFCANVICLCGASWLVWHWAILALAVLLWYLPAAVRARSLWMPVRLPLLNFVAVDFSLLGLHPRPRPVAQMYMVCLLRVLLLLVAIPLCAMSTTIPKWLKVAFSNENAIHILFQGQRLHGQRIPSESLEEWAVMTVVVLALSVLWVFLTVPLLAMALCCASGPFAWERDAALLGDIDDLAREIDSANGHGDWRACLLQMKRLREEHPTLKLTTIGSTFGPAMGTLVHLIMDVATAYTFFSHGKNNPSSQAPDFALGVLTVVNFVFTLIHNCNAGQGNPFAMIWEAKVSFERGVLTDTYIQILYGDQGAHVLISLAINVFGIPFRADNPLKVASAIMAITVTVATCVPFIFQHFDLGAEREALVLGEARGLNAPPASSPKGVPAEALAAQTREVFGRLF